MTVLPSWIFAAMDKAMGPMGKAAEEGMKAAETSVPVIYKILLPTLLLMILGCIIGITVMTIFTLLRKKVPLEDQFADDSQIDANEMTPYEAQSKTRPRLGQVGAVIFILGVFSFTFMGLLTMGRGSSTTEQLRKEGKEKSKKLREANQSSTEIGEDSEDSAMSEFDMKPMDADE